MSVGSGGNHIIKSKIQTLSNEVSSKTSKIYRSHWNGQRLAAPEVTKWSVTVQTIMNKNQEFPTR